MPDSSPVPLGPGSVLVTGGCGFIGSAFLRRMVPLHPEASFVNLDALTYAGHLANVAPVAEAETYTFVRGDIANGDLVRQVMAKHGVQHVVHFAAESHVDRSIHDPLAFVRTNVTGTATLLDAARRAWDSDPSHHRFVHVSTDEVFGALDADDPPFDTETPYAPRSPYSASKAGSDHLARAYHHTFGLPVLITNCSNNYGPYQHPEKLIPLVIERAAAQEAIPVYGRGENIRDWLHVMDHARGIERALLYGSPGRSYLFGGHGERANIDLVRLLCDLVDEALGRPQGTAQKGITFVRDRPGHDFRYAVDSSAAASHLGWAPETTLSDGLRETVQWYLTHNAWLREVQSENHHAYLRAQYGKN